MKLSVAIPTYNSSNYLLDCLKSLKKIKHIDEIVISDDCSRDDEYSKILQIKENFSKSTKKNILINRNDRNLGGFKNKYIAVSKCKNKFVYQIDSDNIAGLNTNEILNVNLKTFDSEVLYLPSKVYVFKKNPLVSSFRKKYKVLLTNSNEVLTKKSVLEAVTGDKNLFIDVKNSWVFNLGNFIVDKKMFLQKMKFPFESSDLPLAADPLAMCYFWLNDGGKIGLIKNFYHFHRLRSDSYWHSAGNDAKISVEFFESKLRELNND